MDPQEALKIIDELAAGRNPVDGEPLPDKHICQEPDVIRSLYAASKALHHEIQRQRRLEVTRARLAANAGAPWNLDEDNALMRGYRSGAGIPALAERHRRTTGAIRSRLEKLGFDVKQSQSSPQTQTNKTAADR
ncbi:MAG: hypothetical protein K0U74_11480 [Alphaproteobacteria bacterium]|nr:hypothetical protein [Alphaproteobacteria bacterium]